MKEPLYSGIVKDIRSDSRGFVLILEFRGKEYLLFFTKAGFMRGGELHRGKQYNMLLEGKVKWTQIIHEKCLSHIICAPSFIRTLKETPHMMESITDSLMLEWREFPIEKPVNYYKPYREIIKAKMEK
uniref:Uncharacterized protein n=1 Tax=viral metagenome TaxID=1070528 RepID=A0A6M3XY28_9ZZZZ